MGSRLVGASSSPATGNLSSDFARKILVAPTRASKRLQFHFISRCSFSPRGKVLAGRFCVLRWLMTMVERFAGFCEKSRLERITVVPVLAWTRSAFLVNPRETRASGGAPSSMIARARVSLLGPWATAVRESTNRESPFLSEAIGNGSLHKEIGAGGVGKGCGPGSDGQALSKHSLGFLVSKCMQVHNWGSTNFHRSADILRH